MSDDPITNPRATTFNLIPETLTLRPPRAVLENMAGPDDVAFTDSPDPDRQLVDNLHERLSTRMIVIRQQIDVLKSKTEEEIKALPESAKKTHNQKHFCQYAKTFENVRTPHLVTARQYQAWGDGRYNEENRGAIVVTTPEEAKRLLEGEKHFPHALFTSSGPYQAGTNDKDVNDLLKACKAVHVQDQDIPILGLRNDPQVYSGADVVTMRSKGKRIACLKLETTMKVRTFLHATPAYNNIMSELIREDPSLQGVVGPTTFVVFGTKDAWSPMHRDKLGLATTLCVLFGEKAIPLWPALDAVEERQWEERGYGYIPGEPPATVLVLQPGEELFMPANMPHAPYTVNDCLMSGTHHIHSRALSTHMDAYVFERRFEDCTNEQVPSQVVKAFKRVREWRNENSDIAPWNDSPAETEDINRAIHLLTANERQRQPKGRVGTRAAAATATTMPNTTTSTSSSSTLASTDTSIGTRKRMLSQTLAPTETSISKRTRPQR